MELALGRAVTPGNRSLPLARTAAVLLSYAAATRIWAAQLAADAAATLCFSERVDVVAAHDGLVPMFVARLFPSEPDPTCPA